MGKEKTMGLLKLLTQDPLAFVLLVVPLLFSVIIHEVAHGWVAYRMGDPTAKMMGRLTLNPLKHLDPLGTLLLFVVGFGWAKPVPVNFYNLRDRRKGLILVSSAGIAANILLAFLFQLLFKLLPQSYSGVFLILIYFMVQINITLAALNLIPIPPLDGSKILMGLAPEQSRFLYSRIGPYGLIIIVGLLYLGVLNPVIAFIRRGIGLLIGLR
jgi:Zn-dependent protease